jgi:hypothetical protein
MLHQVTRRTFVVLLVGLCLGLTLGCEKEEADALLIRKVGLQAVKAAEAHDIAEIMELVTPGFSASPGTYSRKEVRPILLMVLRRYGKFRILHPRFAVSVDASSKTAKLNVPLFLLKEGQTFDESDLEGLQDDPVAWAKKISEKVGDPFFLEATLDKGEDGWLVNHVSILGFKRLQDYR